MLLQARQAPLWRAHQVMHGRIGGAHLDEHLLGRHAAVHQPDPARFAVLPLDALEKPPQCRVVRGVAGQHFVGQRQAFGRHHQSDDDLYTIRPVIARVPEAALVAFWKRPIRFEIGARQIVEQHVVADVEQVSPPSHQMIEDRLLVGEQSVMTTIQLVDLGEPGILAQEIGQGAALKPLAVQPPLAARGPSAHGLDPWGQQAIGDQHEQDLIPARSPAFARAGSLRLAPSRLDQNRSSSSSRHSSSASQHAPHCRGRRSRNSDSLTRTIEASASSPSQRSSGNSVSVRGCAAPSSKTAIDRRHAQFLRVVDLAQLQHVPLHHAPAGDPCVLDNAPVAGLLAILPANLAAQEQDGRQLSAHWRS
jgi:hypothetical protein